MILVHLDHRHVSTINFGWESPEFYARWYGAPLDARTLAEMKGPSIDLNSPDLVPPGAMLAFFSTLLDAHYLEHLRSQYTRFRAALATPAGAQRLVQSSGGGGAGAARRRCATTRSFTSASTYSVWALRESASETPVPESPPSPTIVPCSI